MKQILHFPKKVFFKALLVLTILLPCFYLIEYFKSVRIVSLQIPTNLQEEYNIWIIFTKVGADSALKFKFRNLMSNLVNVSSIPITLNLLVDEKSKLIAAHILNNVRIGGLHFYDIGEAEKKIQDIAEGMMPYFSSSRQGSYYRHVLFYLSLGLYRIAPENQTTVVMLDCDLYFKNDVALLFKEFEGFSQTHLFALGPELNPVYRHVLYKYRLEHKNTSLGEAYHRSSLAISDEPHPEGFPGYNSGVILFNLSAIRQSDLYKNLLDKKRVEELANKYYFRGHLGDQDFYTLMGYEHPELIKTLHCGFNRQLCTFWRDKGYGDVFDSYFRCPHKVIVIHGNCHSPIPRV